MALSLAALMIPLTGLLVSRFAIFRLLRLTDTHWALIMPSLIGITPFYILLFYWSFRRVPGELYEACRLEGMSPPRLGGGSPCHWSDRSPWLSWCSRSWTPGAIFSTR